MGCLNFRMRRTKLKLVIDLVPKTCWYSNLRKNMPRSRWNKLRKQVYSKVGNICEICGADGKLKCHELWKYDDRKHVQKLKGFCALCNMCHLVAHFGFAQILAFQGKLDLEAVIKHFMKVNKVDRKVFENHLTESFTIWKQRSRCKKWHTNLGKWRSLVGKES